LSVTQDIIINLKAEDGATITIRKTRDEIKGLGDAQKETAAQAVPMTRNWGDAVVKAQGLATAGFALYGAIDRVQESNLRLERATLAATKADVAAEAAQNKYAEAVSKFGEGSPEAEKALEALNISKENARLRDEAARQAQDNLNQSYVQFGLSIVPTSITAISSLQGIISALTVTEGGETAAKVAATAATGTHTAATGAYAAVQWLANAAMAACPFIALAIGIGLVVDWIWKVTDGFQNWSKVTEAFTSFYDSYLRPTFEGIVAGLGWIWEKIQPVIEAFRVAGELIAKFNIPAAIASWIAGGAPLPALPTAPAIIPSYQGLTEPVTFTGPTLVQVDRGETLSPRGGGRGEVWVHNYIVLDGRLIQESVSKAQGDHYRMIAGGSLF
jgi:hypothetical protein